MAKSNNQKGKILYLERLLCGTGEDRMVTMQEILAYLLDNGIHAERKSIYDDMEVLRAFGMDIRYRRGKPGGYYLAGDRVKDEPESRSGSKLREGTAEPTDLIEVGSSVPSLSMPDLQDIDKEPYAIWEPDGEAIRRQVKLVCSRELKDQAGRYLGSTAIFREKPDGSVSITAEVTDGPLFYGWLTAMGLQMRLVKPRRMQQSYRDYLKGIAREYKTGRGAAQQ